MELSHLRLAHLGSARATADADSESWRTQARWFGMAAAVGFAFPYVGSSVLDLHHDVSLAIYFASVLALRGVREDHRARRADDADAPLKLGSLLGVLFGVVLVRNLFSEDATPPA